MSDPTGLTAILKNTLAVAKPVVETGCKLIENLLGEPCKVVGAMMADQIYAWQWMNRVRIFNRAQEILDADHMASRVLPPGFLVPLLDAAGYIDDPELQEMWAALLASGVSEPASRHPAFVSVLRELSRDEAIILKTPSPRCFLMDEGQTPVRPRPFKTDPVDVLTHQVGMQFWVNVPLSISLLKQKLSEADVTLADQIDKGSVLLYATHLESLGLVELERHRPYQVQEHILEIKDTEFGKHFIKACCRNRQSHFLANPQTN